MLKKVDASPTTNLQQRNFAAWQCLRWVVIRATTLFNLQRNNVALQVAAICCSYYFTFNNIYIMYFRLTVDDDALDLGAANEKELCEIERKRQTKVEREEMR